MPNEGVPSFFDYNPYVKRKNACSKSLHTLINHLIHLFLLSVAFSAISIPYEKVALQ